MTFEDVCGISLPSVKPSLQSTHTPLLELIRHHGWKQVAMVTQTSGPYRNGAKILQHSMRLGDMEVGFQSDIFAPLLGKLLVKSKLQIVVLYLEPQNIKRFACKYADEDKDMQMRYLWLIPWIEISPINAMSVTCKGTRLRNVIGFQVDSELDGTPAYLEFSREISQNMPLQNSYLKSAAYTYDATMVTMQFVTRELKYAKLDQKNLTDLFNSYLMHTKIEGVTGTIRFDSYGRRILQVSVVNLSHSVSTTTIYKPGVFKNINVTFPAEVGSQRHLDGIPLVLFISMSSVALLGIIYAIAILIFNVVNRKDRVIKMTSPNINVLVILGSILLCGSVGLIGLDSQWVSHSTMATLQQATSYTLSLGFAMIFAAILTKLWRVYVIFMDLNVKGRVSISQNLFSIRNKYDCTCSMM